VPFLIASAIKPDVLLDPACNRSHKVPLVRPQWSHEWPEQPKAAWALGLSKHSWKRQSREWLSWSIANGNDLDEVEWVAGIYEGYADPTVDALDRAQRRFRAMYRRRLRHMESRRRRR
jgi:hypothetical protein